MAMLSSLSTERIEKERLAIPIAASRFLEQKDFRALLFGTMDKSECYKFRPEEEINQGIAYMLLEMC